MDFESPDVEKDFPGLYASESTKKCNESDFSDENHDKSFKKDLISKRKDKKDSKKDRGYAALEGESSPDEDDSKSPSKSKKSKAFKFPTKKSEKREKSREKDIKEKDKDVDKDKKKDKEKKDKEKVKQKERDKKKKHSEDGIEEDYPIFGVPLSVAVERGGCLDGVAIPVVVRNCIDCIHLSGLGIDGLYKVTGVKSKVHAIRRSYNLREPVSLGDSDVAVATCLLKNYLKELPEPILTNELLARFEEAGAIKEVGARELELGNYVKQLPVPNRELLAWLIVHFDTVTMHEKHNKINAQSIAMTFSPVLQMSHRLLTALLCHCKALFPNTYIERYVPPLAPGSVFPESPKEIVKELRKQESLLNQIHKEMNEGFVSKKREEQLWEVQRIVTQLKRKLRTFQRSQEASIQQRSIDEDSVVVEEAKEKNVKADVEVNKKEPTQQTTVEKRSGLSPSKQDEKETDSGGRKQIAENQRPATESHSEKSSGKCSPEKLVTRSKPKSPVEEPRETELNFDVLRLELEHEQLLKFQGFLQDSIDHERSLIEKLRMDLRSYRGYSDSQSDESSTGSTPACLSPESEARMEQLIEDNHVLEEKKEDLIRRIFEERDACMKLRVLISLAELTGRVD